VLRQRLREIWKIVGPKTLEDLVESRPVMIARGYFGICVAYMFDVDSLWFGMS
jgi:hypothetical protein